MERSWKITNLFVGLVLIGLCSGFPIGLENSAADYHTQFLTGLVGVLLTVCGVVFLAGCLCCQRKNGFKEFHNNPVVASSTSSLDHGHINPIANGEFTIFTPLSPPHHNNNVFLANEQIVGQTEIDYNHADIDVRSWFDGTENDFPRTKLKYIKELGKGWFGRAVEGTAQGLNGSDDKQNWTPVAVRILEASATSSERAVFLHDAVIYRCGKHPHILQLLGRSLESVPLLLLQELCPRGDLKKYLQDSRGTVEKLLSSDLPLLWCCQLSSALKHLHDHRLTHPDLAARNCQVVSDLSIKLGDYGLAASLYPEDYYEGAPAVPVRWCAPESLTYTSTTIQPKQITFESNVWSLGVTMWEIYECGAQPYAHLSDDDVISQVLGSANVRLSRPEFSILYTDYIFRLMQLCWSTSESRPSVSQVHLMLTDLMQVYQNTKHITHSEPLISMQDFDKRWDTFKPNSVAKTDNHEFTQESMSMADIDLSDITILNLNLNKDEELLNTKPMSPSLNNLHGSLDNLASGEMDSWLQKVATKTGDMSYVRGLSEAIKDLDNALALENVSSSDSSHQPSPAPENLPNAKNKLEFKLGPTPATSNDLNKTQNSSLTESMQRTSSESETEDENWRRKIERGAYSEKVQQKSKSVTDLMVLTHIDCSESDSETPLPSLDYRVNYKNVRYAPKQNLENVSLMFGSEGNLLSVHDKFQEELRKLQEERKDSLLFVPESISHNEEIPYKQNKDSIGKSRRDAENSSSDEETWTVKKGEDAACTYVNINPSTSAEQQDNSNLSSKNVSPNHRNPESLIEKLSSPTDIQPGKQVYNIFNVTVDANFSPMHLKPNLKEIICYKDLESSSSNFDDGIVEAVNKNLSSGSITQCFQVPKLTELIQNNDDLMDYIITRYDSQDDVNTNNPDVSVNISESKKIAPKTGKELNNNIQNSTIQNVSSSSEPTENIQDMTREFLQNEQQNYELPKVHFDVSQTQEEVSPSSMTHSSLFSSTPFTKRTLKSFVHEDCENKSESLQFSSNFTDLNKEEEKDETESELKYSLETWDNFLGKALDGSRECSGFDEFSSEPQSLLFVDENRILNTTDTVECKNQALIESFNLKSEDDLGLQADVNIVALSNSEQNLNNVSEENKASSILSDELEEENLNDCEIPKVENERTFTVEPTDKTFVCEDKKNEENLKNPDVADVNDVTVVLSSKDEQLDGTYTKETEEGGNNWEPGGGWFLHPQTNSEVSGQIEVSQGEESYVGFSMDDEIMAAIRNELLMKLPQAQGQSSEQVKDSDEWDSEGRSEVLIKYNLYTTPLSPIPEESYSENDSCHFIYNREDSSDSENEDWPEPYEEHNSGLPDTETRSIQNAESPVQEPQHRHTPSQDSCCSNDTLFNLEELTYVVNENENAKVPNDLTEKKGCDLEINKKDAVLDKDLEEPTLKVEEETEANKSKIEDKNKIVEQNDAKEVNEIPLTDAEQNCEGLEDTVLEKTSCNEESNILKNTNNLKTEIFTCNIEPTPKKETNESGEIEDLLKTEEILNVSINTLSNEIAHGRNEIDSSKDNFNGTMLINLEENSNETEITDMKNNQSVGEVEGNLKEEEIETTSKTDNKNVLTNDSNGCSIEIVNKNLTTDSEVPNEEVNLSNLNLENCLISLESQNEKNENNIENIQKRQVNNDLILEKHEIDVGIDEVNGKVNNEITVTKEQETNIDKIFEMETVQTEINPENREINTKNCEVDICKTEIVLNDLENLNKSDINFTESKNKINSEKSELNVTKNGESDYTNLEKPGDLEKSEVTITPDKVTITKNEDSNCTNLEKPEDLEKSEATITPDADDACESANELKQCEIHEQGEVNAHEGKIISSQSEVNYCNKKIDLKDSKDFEKSEKNIKGNEILIGNEVALNQGEVLTSHGEVLTSHGEVNSSKSKIDITNCGDIKIGEVVASKSEVCSSGEFNFFENDVDLEKPGGEVDVDPKEVSVVQDEVLKLQGEVIGCKSEIDIQKVKNFDAEVGIMKSEVAITQDEVDTMKSEAALTQDEVGIMKSEVAITQDEVDIMKSEAALTQDEVGIMKSEVALTENEVVTSHVNELDVDNTGSHDEVNACKSIEELQTTSEIAECNNQRESKQEQRIKCEVNFAKNEIDTMENKINIGADEVNLEKSDLKDKHETDCEKNHVDMGDLEDLNKSELHVGETTVNIKFNENNAAENKVNLQHLENVKKIDADKKMKDAEDEIQTENTEILPNKNEIEKEDRRDEIHNSEVRTNNHEVKVNKLQEVDDHKMDIIENGFYADSDKSEVSIDHINIGFVTKEDGIPKTDNAVKKHESERNGVEIDKFVDIENIDLEINKLNIKNMQNGMITGNSPKWIKENDANLINALDKFNELGITTPDHENTSVQTKETLETESSKTEDKCDFPDISLIVENNPNYITEFLNHERQSSISSLGSSRDDDSSYHVNINFDAKNTTERDYVNVDDIAIKLVEEPQPTDSASYVNTNELLDLTSNFNSQPEYVNIVQREDGEEHLYDPVANDGEDLDIYDALTDIRFTGPTDIQLMSTSFSESADIDEQDWDSGSDTRSSSSGEFIWKEGEHEESVKALRAAPQDVMATEKLTPMEDIEEVSTESSEDEDGDSPEFVPSAWDKYATPTKSALRSPEKTLEKAEIKQHKKPKGVWFKKQKYHCVYEYPREPESPNVNTFDLWQPVSTSLIDWEVDTSPYVSTFDGPNPPPECYQQLDNHTRNLYQLPDFTSGMTALDDEFFISSTARPFESFGGLSSQFFPGQTTSDQWMDLTKQPNENITPDSGVEDITPSNVDSNEFLQAPPKSQVQPLKLLAATALKQNQISELKSSSKDALGGLRHARNKLKLDLPPSPSAFTSTKAFTIEPPEEPVMKREVPTFTTFGKSRFLVQHVDTPTCDEENDSKNVSFEALPYKPAQIKEDKAKIEVVRGEASLLDSADEDSGIESSTLERKKITNVAD